MSIYNLSRVKELAIEKMKQDLGEQGYTRDNKFFKSDEEYEEFFTIEKEEFKLYMLLHNIAEDIKEWTFYTSDTVYDEIIAPNSELKSMYEYFDTEECLEEAKSERLIKGFLELGNDLWMIYE